MKTVVFFGEDVSVETALKGYVGRKAKRTLCLVELQGLARKDRSNAWFARPMGPLSVLNNVYGEGEDEQAATTACEKACIEALKEFAAAMRREAEPPIARYLCASYSRPVGGLRPFPSPHKRVKQTKIMMHLAGAYL